MIGTFKILRNGNDEIWNITNSRFSIFSRGNDEILNFWVEANEIANGSMENRSENGINLEILMPLMDTTILKEFDLKVPYLEVPTLGEMDKYVEYQKRWGEDKNLYYNIYYDEHIDPRNCTINIKENNGTWLILLKGVFDDRFQEGVENTNFEISAESKLETDHKGYWTE